MLTQYKSHSLDRHITTTWRMSTLLGNYVTPVPAQQRLGPRWYTGSADAIFQSLNLVYDEQPDYVVVFGADHVYRMDPSQMVEQHIESGAGVTVAGIRVPQAQADRVRRHRDRARRPATSRRSSRSRRTRRGLPDDPDECFASMGNYVFTTDALLEALQASTPATRARCTTWAATSSRCWPSTGAAKVYDFADNDVPGATERDRGYWRDVGTLDAYYDAHMDLVSVHPVFNLYNRQWPILTHHAAAAAGEVRRGRRRARVDRRRRLDRLRRPRATTRCVVARRADRARRRGVEGSVLMPGVDDRPRRRRPPGDPGQERRRPRRRARSASTSSATASSTPSRTSGVVVLGKNARAVVW